MENILKKYCSDSIGSQGLFLFNPPTGSGKTYNVLKYIYDNYKDFCKEGRKIFFITNLKKNLPFHELRDDFFVPDGKLADFEKDVLFIDSNQDFVIKSFSDVADQVPDYLKSDDYFKIRSLASRIEKYEKKGELHDVVEEYKRQLRERHEPNFRKKISDFLKKNYSTKQKRISAIKNDKALQWIGKLYPTVFTDKRKVYFLSIDKFFAKNTTLIEPSYYFNENKITKDALLFIDEFDSTKNSILSNIIEKGLRQKIDFIQLFNSIHYALLGNVFPKSLLAESEDLKRKKGSNSKILTPEAQLSSFKEKADKVSEEFNLRTSYKTENSADNESRSLLFHDFRYHSVLRNDKRFIEIQYNPSTRINQIHFTDSKPKSGKNTVIYLLNNIRGFLSYFQTGIKHLATNYFELKKENNRPDFEYSFESALRTVLEEFGIEDKYKNFLIDNILAERRLSNINEDARLYYDLSVYQNGFRYYDFVDSEEHDTITKAYIYSFQNTPEKYILKLAEKAKVIGISATARMETVTGNFDIDYLSEQLGSKYYQLEPEEVSLLRESYESTYPGYEDLVDVNVEWIKNDKQLEEGDWKELFGDLELAKFVINKLPTSSYNKGRYFKIAKVYKAFLLKDDIQAFLCLLSKFPKTNDSNLDLNLLDEIFKFLIQQIHTEERFNFNGDIDVSKTYRILKSKGFSNQKDKLVERLEQGEKIFIISTYQTVGAGQNLHFKSPNPEKLVRFIKNSEDDWNKENKTDINGIFLDFPTRLLVNITKDLKEVDFATYLFQLEFLQEHGDLSMRELKSELKFAFKNLVSSSHSKGKINRDFSTESLYQKYNFSQHISKVVVQALGRICRTNLKSRNIYIYGDEALFPHIKTVDQGKHICLYEFRKLISDPPRVPFNEISTDDYEGYLNNANTISRKTNTLVNKFLDTAWSIRSTEEWSMLRKMCLFYPVLTSEEAKSNSRFAQLYIKLPQPISSYSFEMNGDYEEIDIDLTEKSRYKVSEKSARLKELMMIPGVEHHFKNNKWATSFQDANFILPPVLFNNIYKGALGEEIGKFIFENHLDIKLKELEVENFEMFDFVTEKGVYIDFKHWKESTSIDAKSAHEEIYRKLDRVQGQKVLIINILAEGSYDLMRTKDGRIVEIPFLFNLEDQCFSTKNIDAIIDEIENY